jgi:copper chaperone
MLRLTVSGMTCDHCVSAVAGAVRAVPGVEDVLVDLARGEVAIKGQPSERAVRDAIAEEGYEVQGRV